MRWSSERDRGGLEHAKTRISGRSRADARLVSAAPGGMREVNSNGDCQTDRKQKSGERKEWIDARAEK